METILLIIVIFLFISACALPYFLEKRRMSYALMTLISFFILSKIHNLIFFGIMIILNCVLSYLSKEIAGFQVKPLNILDKLIYLLAYILSVHFFDIRENNMAVALLFSLPFGVMLGYILVDFFDSYLLTWIIYLFGKKIVYDHAKIEFSMKKIEGRGHEFKIYRLKLNDLETKFKPSTKALKTYADELQYNDYVGYKRISEKIVTVKLLPIIKKMIILEIKNKAGYKSVSNKKYLL